MIWMMKLLHLTMIAIWSGGLVALPFLLFQRRSLTGEDLHRLHRLVRALYVSILSPAAFVAIASGTALVFLRGTFVEWFSIKLSSWAFWRPCMSAWGFWSCRFSMPMGTSARQARCP